MISDYQLERLRAEAGEYGDEELVKLCDLALAGDADAREDCEMAIREARAQVEEPNP